MDSGIPESCLLKMVDLICGGLLVPAASVG
jgi:hypothetical protein